MDAGDDLDQHQRFLCLNRGMRCAAAWVCECSDRATPEQYSSFRFRYAESLSGRWVSSVGIVLAQGGQKIPMERRELERKGLPMKYPKRPVEKPRTYEGKSLIAAAREAMTRFKAETGIKAIVPHSKNQRMGEKKRERSKRIEENHQMRKMSRGAASEVRIIKPEE